MIQRAHEEHGREPAAWNSVQRPRIAGPEVDPITKVELFRLRRAAGDVLVGKVDSGDPVAPPCQGKGVMSRTETDFEEPA